MEIEERAYRMGFVCHEHAVNTSDEDEEEGGFEFRDDGTSQHCWGALAMHNKAGGSVPWNEAIAEDPTLEERWWNRADMKAYEQVFESEEAFFDANDPTITTKGKRTR